MAPNRGGGGHEAAAVEGIENRILLIRGRRVMLDADLAAMYGVPTKRLNEQVKRNAERFPDDFVFQLREDEMEILSSQFETSNGGHGGRRCHPYAFTEHGAIMAANAPVQRRAARRTVRCNRLLIPAAP